VDTVLRKPDLAHKFLIFLVFSLTAKSGPVERCLHTQSKTETRPTDTYKEKRVPSQQSLIHLTFNCWSSIPSAVDSVRWCVWFSSSGRASRTSTSMCERCSTLWLVGQREEARTSFSFHFTGRSISLAGEGKRKIKDVLAHAYLSASAQSGRQDQKMGKWRNLLVGQKIERMRV